MSERREAEHLGHGAGGGGHMNARVRQLSTSVMASAKEALVTERSEGINKHSTLVMSPTKEVS